MWSMISSLTGSRGGMLRFSRRYKPSGKKKGATHERSHRYRILVICQPIKTLGQTSNDVKAFKPTKYILANKSVIELRVGEGLGKGAGNEGVQEREVLTICHAHISQSKKQKTKNDCCIPE